MTHVLLWDIDGTLLSTARAGVYALEHAVREVCGVEPDIRDMKTAGLTDQAIAAIIIDAYGGTADGETVQRFLRVYEAALPERLGWREGWVFPGVRENLAALAGRSDVLNLLLTGNTAAGAAAKLRHYDLACFFDAGGAFCVDGAERAEIARRAIDLAGARLNAEVDLARTFVIGDTPHDIECGHAVGARTIAVTFTHTARELAAHDPWLVLDRLPEPAEFMQTLGIATPDHAGGV
jgi:phosphoglycolate phosphatase